MDKSGKAHAERLFNYHQFSLKTFLMARTLIIVALSVFCVICGSLQAEEVEYAYFDTDAADLSYAELPAEPVCPQCGAAEGCKHGGGRRYLMDRQVRAGCAHTVGWWAVPGTNCRNYAAGYVGGGAVVDGDGPDQFEDGTWGLDYIGIVVRKRVFLNWWHGRKYQGGAGAYKTDGPRVRE